MTSLMSYNLRRKMFKDQAKEIHPVRFTYEQISLLETILAETNTVDYYPEETIEIFTKITDAEAEDKKSNA